MSTIPTSLTKRCRKCGEDREISLFQYILTPAQARAQGYSGHTQIKWEGKTCNLCKRKPRPLNKLRKDELLKKIEAGDLHENDYKLIMSMREANANLRKAEAVRRRWAKEQSAKWHAYLKPLRDELTKASRMYYNADKRGDTQLKDFSQTYIQILKRMDMKLSNMAGDNNPPEDHWKTYATPQEKDTLERALDAIDSRKKLKMRYPTLLVRTNY